MSYPVGSESESCKTDLLSEMLQTSVVFILLVCLALTSGSTLEDRERRAVVAEDLSAAQIYMNENGTSTTQKVVVQKGEVQVSTDDGMLAVLDYGQNTLTMRPSNEEQCIIVQLNDDQTKMLPTLDEVKRTLTSKQEMKAPDSMMELKLVKADADVKLSLSPLSKGLCGKKAPMFLKPAILTGALYPVNGWWCWWPWRWYLRRCPWCWYGPCFYWPWWVYWWKYTIIIYPF